MPVFYSDSPFPVDLLPIGVFGVFKRPSVTISGATPDPYYECVYSDLLLSVLLNPYKWWSYDK